MKDYQAAAIQIARDTVNAHDWLALDVDPETLATRAGDVWVQAWVFVGREDIEVERNL